MCLVHLTFEVSGTEPQAREGNGDQPLTVRLTEELEDYSTRPLNKQGGSAAFVLTGRWLCRTLEQARC